MFFSCNKNRFFIEERFFCSCSTQDFVFHYGKDRAVSVRVVSLYKTFPCILIALTKFFMCFEITLCIEKQENSIAKKIKNLKLYISNAILLATTCKVLDLVVVLEDEETQTAICCSKTQQSTTQPN